MPRSLIIGSLLLLTSCGLRPSQPNNTINTVQTHTPNASGEVQVHTGGITIISGSLIQPIR